MTNPLNAADDETLLHMHEMSMSNDALTGAYGRAMKLIIWPVTEHMNAEHDRGTSFGTAVASLAAAFGTLMGNLAAAASDGDDSMDENLIDALRQCIAQTAAKARAARQRRR